MNALTARQHKVLLRLNTTGGPASCWYLHHGTGLTRAQVYSVVRQLERDGLAARGSRSVWNITAAGRAATEGGAS